MGLFRSEHPRTLVREKACKFRILILLQNQVNVHQVWLALRVVSIVKIRLLLSQKSNHFLNTKVLFRKFCSREMSTLSLILIDNNKLDCSSLREPNYESSL